MDPAEAPFPTFLALADRASPELRALWERVGRGMVWLVEHDPTGAYHLWYKAGLTPSSPMPAQDDRGAEGIDHVDGWLAYYPQRRIWEQLWAQMTKLERRELAAMGGVVIQPQLAAVNS